MTTDSNAKAVQITNNGNFNVNRKIPVQLVHPHENSLNTGKMDVFKQKQANTEEDHSQTDDEDDETVMYEADDVALNRHAKIHNIEKEMLALERGQVVDTRDREEEKDRGAKHEAVFGKEAEESRLLEKTS